MLPAWLLVFAAAAANPAFTSPAPSPAEYGHGLSTKQAHAGWISLFDGRTTFGWSDASIVDGSLRGGSTTSEFGDVEMKIDVRRAGTLTVGKNVYHLTVGTHALNVSGGGVHPIRLDDQLAIHQLAVRPLNLRAVFTGRDFIGWSVVKHRRRAKPKQTTWRVENGAIRATGGPGALELEGHYADLIMQIDVRTLGALTNGGVFVRSIPGQFMNGYETQVFNACYNHDPAQPARYSTGGIDDRQLARRLVSRDRETFTMTIVANGPHFATWVNGVQMTDWTDTRKPHDNPREGLRLEAGSIQLQAHDPETDVEFRNIRLVELH